MIVYKFYLRDAVKGDAEIIFAQLFTQSHLPSSSPLFLPVFNDCQLFLRSVGFNQ
jgi:hypothetical protein